MPSFHAGVDLRAHHSLIYSILPGRIIGCGYQPLLGRFVRIDHGDTQSVYGHLSAVLVENGSLVEAGSIIGLSGNSGRTTAEHLHFAVFYGRRPVHPLKFLFHLQAILEK